MSVKEIPELQSLLGWLGKFPRDPRQTHRVHESDSEIIRISSKLYLALTVDSVSEEIAFKLYRDPYTMGWVTAMASLSDLAAVGAKPEGFLFSAQIGRELDEAGKKRMAEGLRAALKTSRTHLLGGDTGAAVSSVLSGVALGTTTTPPTSRIGMKPGDLICITGKSGIGPALGFRHLLGGEMPEECFRPRARVAEGLKLRGFASASMDTSDGIAATLHSLLTLNNVGMEIQADARHLDSRAVAYCQAQGIPALTLWFGEHGDFELIFSVPQKKLASLKRSFKNFSVIGRAVSKKSASRTQLDFGFLSTKNKSTIEEIRSSFDSVVAYLRAAPLSFE